MNDDLIHSIKTTAGTYRFAAACVILSILCIGATAYLWNDVSDLDDLRDQREKEGEAALQKLVSGPPLRQELDFVRDTTLRIDQNLVVEDNLAENLWYFYKIEEQSKARLRELRQLTSSQPDSDSRYKKIPYSIEVVGTYSQVSSFLRAIETGPHLANISGFSLKRRDPGGMMLSLNLGIDLLGKK